MSLGIQVVPQCPKTREPESQRKSQLYVVSLKKNLVFYMVSFAKVNGTRMAPNGFIPGFLMAP